MVYGDFKDLARRTVSDRALRDKAFNIAKKKIWWISKRSCFCGLCFDKASASPTDKYAKAGGVNNEVKQNEQIAEQLQKPIIKNVEQE